MTIYFLRQGYQSSQNKIVGLKFEYSYNNAILTLIPARFIIKYIFSFWITNGSHWWGMLEVRIHICYNFGQSHLWNFVGRGWYILLWLKTTTSLKSQDSLLLTRGHHSSLWAKGTRLLKSQLIMLYQNILQFNLFCKLNRICLWLQSWCDL